MLDGDREELRTIRNELASLRAQASASASAPSVVSTGASPSKVPSVVPTKLGAGADVKGTLSTLLSTGLYDSQDSLIMEVNQQQDQQQQQQQQQQQD